MRPLSTQLLQITIPEMQGLIDRQKLESISGRSRRKQLAWVAKFGLMDCPSPAREGLLTDQKFSLRLKELLKKRKNINGNDLELLKLGRHSWSGRVKIVVGGDENENKLIKKLAQTGDWLVLKK